MLYQAFLLLIHLTASSTVEQEPLNYLPSFPPKHLLPSDEPYPKLPGQRHPYLYLYYRSFSEQTFIGTHDAAAIRTPDNNWSLSGNQYFNVSVQLDSGIRLLQAQGHHDPSGDTDDIRLCHYSCALMDGGSLHDHLLTVRTFLDANPEEIVTLLFVNTGPSLRQWMKAFYDTGLDSISYSPPPELRSGRMRTRHWPSPKEMTRAGKRVITFLSSGADENRAPYLLNQFDYIFETNFGIERPDQYTCLPSRPTYPGGFVPDRLSLVNHFLYAKFLNFRYPNASFANITNGAGFTEGELGEHAARCRDVYGRRPNFLLVDFFNEGNVFDVEESLNGS
ncbi:PLC-like phosphodiesterase [Polychaeton citri CBS 116435]|uniref:PLC-like phosphodiesterase n=1 Tax=Polychaeton citri CBS 116435 TaxID=1314669 RepID=A0A9P4Q9N7_9PEZI|nr:PLC-like phosphodiesterase [Polychaeton citri CBS 116435]